MSSLIKSRTWSSNDLEITGSLQLSASHRTSIVDSQINGLLNVSGGTENQVIKNRFGTDGRLVVENAALDLLVEHNQFTSQATAVRIAGATNITVRGNVTSAVQTALEVVSSSSGLITRNDFAATTTVVDIVADFDGLVERNLIHGGQTGIAHHALTLLSANSVFENHMGIVSSIDDPMFSLGFDTGLEPNQIHNNDFGVHVTGRIQNQHIFDNEIGATGAGVFGGDSLETANLVTGNRTGINFEGDIQFNRIAGNEIGITASDRSLIAHNLIYRNTNTSLLVAGTSDVRIVHNTFYTADGNNIWINDGAQEVEIRNNILWVEAGYDLYVANDSQSGFFSDYNLWHATDTGTLIHWIFDFNDILDWQQDVFRFDFNSSGRTEVNPSWSMPQFASRAQDDFQLLEVQAHQRFSSPATDAGDPTLDLGLSTTHNNLLQNGSFENGLVGWATNIEAVSGAPDADAFDQSSYYSPGNSSTGTATQVVDLVDEGFSTTELDSRLLSLVFGGRVRSGAEDAVDRGQISLSFIDGAQQTISTVTINADNTHDRWELVGERIAVPFGTRRVEYEFLAVASSDDVANSYLDHAFIHVLPTRFAPDLGAFGNTSGDATTDVEPLIRLLSPDLYVDWERGVSQEIRWETFGNEQLSAVKIDLYQDGAEGPNFITTIDNATADDGIYNWTPQLSGIDYGTYGLRIQVSLVGNQIVFDRSTEAFTVPENTTTFFANDDNVTDDEYTSMAGSHRNTGRIASAPKPNLATILRLYSVSSDTTLFVDTGDYFLFDPLVISAATGVGDDDGFELTGPTDATRLANIEHAHPATVAPIIELNDADFVKVRNLALTNALYGLLVNNNSTSFVGSDLTLSDHSLDGIYVTGGSDVDLLQRVTSRNNLRHGFNIEGQIDALLDSHAHDNAKTGIRLSQPQAVRVEGNLSEDNLEYGIAISGSASGAVIGNPDLDLGRGNIVLGNQRDGIYVLAGSVLVAGNTIRNQLSQNSAGIRLGNYSGIDVQGNIIANNDIGVFGSYQLITGNRVYSNLTGISTHSSSTVEGNVVYSNNLGISSRGRFGVVQGNLVYANSDTGIELANKDMSLVGNTVYEVNGNAVTIGGNNLVVRDNIIHVAEGYGLAVSESGQFGFDSDFNLFSVTETGSVGDWAGNRSGLSQWQNATFGDGNSLAGDPLFVDVLGPDGQLGYVSDVNDGRDDDFHLRSTEGRFTGSLAPVLGPNGLPVTLAVTELTDATQSPAIDRGDNASTLENEPLPNGGFVNLGAFGNTEQASKSPLEYVLLQTPNGSETWPAGQTFPVRWRSHDQSGTVEIDLLIDGQNDPVIAIASAEPNDGEFLWTIPDDIEARNDYLIRVQRSNNVALFDVTDTTLVITQPITAYYVNDGSLAGDELMGPTGNPMSTGDDANDGLSPGTAKASIRSVLETYDLGAGDVIYVNTGEYVLTNNILITADDSGVYIQGPQMPDNHAVLNRDGGSYVFEFLEASDVTIDSLSITGGGSGIHLGHDSNNQNISILNNHIYDNSTGISSSSRSNTEILIQGNEIFESSHPNTTNYGIHLFSPGEVSIIDNQIYGNDAGIFVYQATVQSVIVANNEIFANKNYGLYNWAGGSSLVVDSNEIYGHQIGGSFGIRLDSGGTARANSVHHNLQGIQLYNTNAIAEGNQVYANDIGISTLNRDEIIRGNQVYDNETGIQIGSDNVEVLNNRIYENLRGINVATNSDQTEIINNTFSLSDGAGVLISGAFSELRNNIFDVKGGAAIQVTDAGQSGFRSDYNLFNISAPGLVADWGNVEFNNRVDWIYELGFDRNGVDGDPQFVDADGTDDILGFSREPVGSATYLDDDGPDVERIGPWDHVTDNGGYGSDYWTSTNVNDGSVTRWTFDGLTPGATYQIATTWVPSFSYAWDTAFEFYENEQFIGETIVNQYNDSVPDDFEDAGIWWEALTEVTTDGETIVVELVNTTRSGRRVVADAVRLQQIDGDKGGDDNLHVTLNAPGIDAGNPDDGAIFEPRPSGDRVNLGAYGNTPEATTSQPQIVQVLSPNGLEKVNVGQAIEIEWRSSGLLDLQTVEAFNSGSNADWSNNPFLTHRDLTRSTASAIDRSQIAHAAPESVYQTADESYLGSTENLTYDVPLTPGGYRITLHFAELNATRINQRVFDIQANGNVVRENLDIIAETGGRFIATTVSFDLNVLTESGLFLELINDATATSYGAVLSGMEISRYNTGGVSAPTFDLALSTNGGSTWRTIASGQSVDRTGRGSYLWTADEESDNALIRVSANSGSQPDDTSNGLFQIAPAGNAYFVTLSDDADFSNNEYTTAAGSNLNHGKAPDQPMASLSALVNAYDLRYGDVIYVDSGDYALIQNLLIGEEDSGITIQGPQQPENQAIFDRNNSVSGSFGIEFVNAADVVIDGLTVKGAEVGVMFANGTNNQRITIQNSQFIDNAATGISVDHTNHLIDIRNNLVAGLDSTPNNGIYLIRTGEVMVHGNEIFGNRYGVFTSQINLSPVGVIQNRIHNNIDLGVYAASDAEFLTLEGNQVYGHRENGKWGILLDRGATAIDNEVFQNATGIYLQGDNNLLQGNRIFANQNAVSTGNSSNGNQIVGNQIYANQVGVEINEFGNRVANNQIYDHQQFGVVVNDHTNEVINNSFVQSTGDALYVHHNTSSVDLENRVRNNIFVIDGGNAIHVTQRGQANFDSDYNQFQITGDGNFAQWGQHVFDDPTSWTFELGFDRNSLYGDPQFVDADGNDDILGFSYETIGAAQILDDDSVGAELIGDWTHVTDAGFNDDYWRATNPNDGAIARWTFTDLVPGATYQVATTWVPSFSHAWNSEFKVYQGERLAGRAIRSQYASDAPDDFNADGAWWEELTITQIDGDSLVVELTNLSNSGRPVSADAIRIQQIVGDHGMDDDFQLVPGAPGIDSGENELGNLISEPGPNGARVNLGAFGNTPQATSSSQQTVHVLRPNGLEKFSQGRVVPIEWQSNGLLDRQLLASLNNGPSTEDWASNPFNTYRDLSRSTTADIDTSQVALPAPDSVYQSYDEVWAVEGRRLAYQVPLPAGNYEVTLHFMEPSVSQAGQRVFDIIANGSVVQENYDIFAQTNGRFIANSMSFEIELQTTGLSLNLLNDPSASSFGAILAGMEISRIDSTGLSSPTFDVELSTDNGSSWRTIASGLLINRNGRGQFNWVADELSDQALIRVTANQGTMPTDLTNRSFQIAPSGNLFYVNAPIDGDFADNEYTSVVGNNWNHGKSPDRPMASLAALLNSYQLTSGDLVLVDTGEYASYGETQLRSIHSGVVIRGPQQAGHEAVLERDNIEFGSYVIDVSSATDVSIDSLTITGGRIGVHLSRDVGNENISIRNNKIFDNYQYGVLVNPGNPGVLIDENTIFGSNPPNISAAGIYVWNGSDLQIARNEIYGNTQGVQIDSAHLEPIQIIGNEIHDNTSTGIYNSSSGDSLFISGNTIYGHLGENDSGIRASRAATISGNSVFDNNFGIELRGIRVSVHHNRLYANQVGVIAPRSYGEHQIYANQVYSNATGIQLDFWFNQVENNLVYANTDLGIVINERSNRLINNTVYQGVGDAIVVNGSDSFIRNNIIHVDTGYALNVTTTGQTGLDSDFNLFSLPFSESQIASWAGSDIDTLASWQAVSGQDSNSRQGDPLFVDIDGADNVFGFNGVDGGADDNFYLAKNSPAIDVADAWNAPPTDSQGSPVFDDLGTANSGRPDYFERTSNVSVFDSPLDDQPQNWRFYYGYRTLDLPFNFPFYDQSHTRVYVAANGFLQFGTTSGLGSSTIENSFDQLLQYPRIAGLWDNLRTDGTTDDIFIDDSTAGQITIRWDATHEVDNSDVNFAITLFENGEIRFDYGTGNSNLTPTIGISAGDGRNFQRSTYDGQDSLDFAQSVKFEWLSSYRDFGAFEFRGSSLDVTAPTVVSTKPLAPVGGLIRQIDVVFSEEVNPIDARAIANYELRDDGGNGIFGDSDDTVYAVIPSYQIGNDFVILDVVGGIPLDSNYLLTVYGDTSIHDLAGIKLDGDGDGLPGGNFEGDPANLDPVADAGGPYGLDEGQILYLDGGSSTDPNNDELTYAWDLDGDGQFDDANAATASVSWSDLQAFGINNQGQYPISLRVSDGRGGVSTETTSLTITNAPPTNPEDTDGAANEILEGAPNGATVGLTVSASDPADPVSYQLTDDAGGRFVIDSQSGVVTVLDTTLLNFEANSIHTITVQANDGDGGASMQSFDITVLNADPTAPSDTDVANNEVREDSQIGDTVGITASSTDPNGPDVTFTLSDDAEGRFTIDLITGVVSVLDNSRFDFDTDPRHSITVEAHDGSGGVSSVDFEIEVVDVNNAPEINPIAESTHEDAGNFVLDLLEASGATDPDATDLLSVSSLTQDLSASNRQIDFALDGNSIRFDTHQFNDLSVGQTEDLVFDFSVSDDSGQTNATVQSTLTIVVEGRNDRPVISVIEDATTEDAQNYLIDLLLTSSATDADMLDSLSVSTVELDPVASSRMVGFSVNGSQLTFDPSEFDDLALGEHATLVFNFSVQDDSGQLNDTAESTLTVRIDGQNDSPTAEPISQTTNEDAGIFSLNLLANSGADDVDISDILSVTDITLNEQASDRTIPFSQNGNFLEFDTNEFNDLLEGQSERLVFDFVVSDDSGAANADTTSSLTVVVQGRNDAGPKVTNIRYDDDTGQRSVVRYITVDFDTIVTVDEGAFVVRTQSGNNVDVVAELSVVDGKTRAVLAFGGKWVDAYGSLGDGHYELVIVDTKIRDANNNFLDGDDDGIAGNSYRDEFFRLYGDINGDQQVNILDLFIFRNAYNNDDNYEPGLDYNDDGVINILDFVQFRDRYGSGL